MRIAICDDNIENLSELRGYIEEYFTGKAGKVSEICSFGSAKELLREIQKKRFDIYFLDVVIPELNGMELGRIIRSEDQRAVIVYITVSREFAFEAFGVQAFQYLQKPVDRAKLSDTMDRILHLLEKMGSSKICVRTKEGLVNIDMADIMYVENISRCTVYTMKDGTCITSVCNRTSFEKSVSFLSREAGFVQPHKSYFVNMHFIRTFGPKSISLDDGTQIAVSRKRFADTKKTYLEFLAAGGQVL